MEGATAGAAVPSSSQVRSSAARAPAAGSASCQVGRPQHAGQVGGVDAVERPAHRVVARVQDRRADGGGGAEVEPGCARDQLRRGRRAQLVGGHRPADLDVGDRGGEACADGPQALGLELAAAVRRRLGGQGGVHVEQRQAAGHRRAELLLEPGHLGGARQAQMALGGVAGEVPGPGAARLGEGRPGRSTRSAVNSRAWRASAAGPGARRYSSARARYSSRSMRSATPRY